jgi:uncharacterized protein YbjT (DUF2867 family)
MKALIIGATGATGKDLIPILLQDPAYTEVVLFVRRPTGQAHKKITEIITNFDHPGRVAEQITGDVLFSCLGTTLKAAGSKEAQRHIDYDIPLKFAQIAKSNDVGSVVLLSAYGASPTSNVFYSKLKGQLEQALNQLKFPKIIIFRPGLLLRKDTDRAGEKLSAGLLNILNRVGLLRKFKPLPTTILAEKMAKSPRTFNAGSHVIELNEIFKL